MSNDEKNLGKLIKEQRKKSGLRLRQLSEASGVSPSHLGRIERGERFPSANVLRKIAKPLGLEEVQLLTLAGYLSPQPSLGEGAGEDRVGRLDPYVAAVLSHEPVHIQRSLIGILAIVKAIAGTKE